MENSDEFPTFQSSNNNNNSVYFFQDMTQLTVDTKRIPILDILSYYSPLPIPFIKFLFVSKYLSCQLSTVHCQLNLKFLSQKINYR